MKKLHKLVIKSYLGPFVITFFLALFVILMQFLWKYIDDLVGKGLQWYIIAELMFYASATFVPLALPLAVLLSSLMTFGNMGERYELVAARAAGISLRKVLQPLFVTSIIICIAAFYFSNNILPVANLKWGALLWDVREHKPALNIKEGIYYKGIDNYVIKVGKKENDGRTIRDIMVYNNSDRQGNTDLTIARTGRMELTPDKRFLVFTLYDGYNYNEDMKDRKNRITRPFRRTYFKEQYQRFDLSSFAMVRTDEDFFKDNYKMLNLKQLNVAVDSLMKDLNKKNEEDAKNIINNYYYFAYIYANDSIKKDTVPQDTNKFLQKNYIDNFGKNERGSIIQTAIDIARNTKRQVEFADDDISYRKEMINRHEIEWNRKFSLSFACLVLFLIGAPLGAIIRKGGLGLPLVVSIGLFIMFHIISITGEKFATEGILIPYQGMWLASSILFPVGIFLMLKATTDSSMLSTEGWWKFFRKLFGRKK